MPVGTAANYFWFIFKTTEELESLHKNGRLVVGKTDRVEGGEKPCSWHSWQKYVGIREVYHYCTNCNAKRFVDWTSIKDEKEY